MTINCSAPGHIPVGRPKPRALEKRKRSDERTGTGGPIKWPCTAREAEKGRIGCGRQEGRGPTYAR